MLCPHCGSDDVTRDGILRWNGDAWEMSSELDYMTCDECGEDVNEFDQIDAVDLMPNTPPDAITIGVWLASGAHGWELGGVDELTLADLFRLNPRLQEERDAILDALIDTSTFREGEDVDEFRIWVIAVKPEKKNA